MKGANYVYYKIVISNFGVLNCHTNGPFQLISPLPLADVVSQMDTQTHKGKR